MRHSCAWAWGPGWSFKASICRPDVPLDSECRFLRAQVVRALVVPYRRRPQNQNLCSYPMWFQWNIFLGPPGAEFRKLWGVFDFTDLLVLFYTKFSGFILTRFPFLWVHMRPFYLFTGSYEPVFVFRVHMNSCCVTWHIWLIWGGFLVHRMQNW